MTTNPILVTGATGKTGRRIVALLRERNLPVRSASRRGDARFDWDDADTWTAAVLGVEVAYLVVPDLGTREATEKVARFATVLAAAGGRRVVMVSTPEDGTDFSGEVRATKRAVEEAGLPVTSLRLRWFDQNFSEDFLRPFVMAGSLRLPAGDGREAFVDAADIAQVAVAALTDSRHAGIAYELTGPHLLGFADVAAELTKATGRPVDYVAVTPEQFISEELERGSPIDWATLASDLYRNIADGRYERTTSDVEVVLGRPARAFGDFAREAAWDGAWRH